jgi:quercetin dioxygenase-like cupin family protein
MRTLPSVLLGSLAGLALVGCASPSPTMPPEELRLENLERMALAEAFTPGREVIVSYVEIPANTTMEWHTHPGEEFHYYLEGEVTIEIEGHEDIRGTPGTVGHVPFLARHTAVTGEEGARAVVFRVHTAGEPVRYLEGGGEGDR